MRPAFFKPLSNIPFFPKKNAQGYLETWIGFKFHVDVNDCGFPVSMVFTSALVHDSQVAIPLMKMTSSKVDYLYDLMDSAYDAQPIYEVSRGLGHVPLIDKNLRGKEVLPMAPHEALRYNEPTVSERFNNRLKGEFGGKNVRVRGYEKVKLRLLKILLPLKPSKTLDKRQHSGQSQWHNGNRVAEEPKSAVPKGTTK